MPHSSSHDRNAEKRAKKIYPIAWSNRHGQMENTKEPFPSRGHCWRAALLAVFRLIVVGFVSGCKPVRLANWLARACIAVVSIALASADQDHEISSVSAKSVCC
jgi:hypothetical protein